MGSVLLEKKLSVIIPAYNEEERIGQTLAEVTGYLDRRQYEYEVIVIDDGSGDSTPEKIAAVSKHHAAVRVLRLPVNRGKGEAVKAGISQARYGHCLFMDADNATSIREWDKFEPCFEQGAQAVMASRHLPGSKIVYAQPWSRRFLGAGYRILCRGLFGIRTSDFNCGFKAYRTDLAKKVYAENQMTDWTFDVETLCRLRRCKIFFIEVPVTWTHHDKKAHLAPFRAAFRTFFSLIKLKRLF